MHFSTLLQTVVLAIIGAQVTANPVPAADYLISVDQLIHWLDTTDANITYIGEPINVLTPRDALTTTVTYCNKRIHDICGGDCNVYTGGPTCIDVPGTACLAATSNVGFCDRKDCGGSCNQLSTCGTHLPNENGMNFCFTPGTASILVGP